MPKTIVSGTLLDAADKPLLGYVAFTPDTPVVHVTTDHKSIFQVPVIATLDEFGHFEAELQEADGEGVNPQNFTYRAVLNVHSANSRTRPVEFSFAAPSGATLTLDEIMPVTGNNGIPMVRGEDGAPGAPGAAGKDGKDGRERPAEFYITDYGAVADGVSDIAPACNAALLAAHRAGGGHVIVPPGAWTAYSQIGFDDFYLENVKFGGIVPRGVRWSLGDGALDPDGKPWVAAAHIRAATNTQVIGGLWENCVIEGLALNADMRGSAAIKAHFSKTRVAWNELLGWSGYGMLLNNGDLTDDLGFLNRIEYNNVSDTGEEVGVGIQAEYRFIDSWIQFNNVEAYNGADIQINSGGPFRVIGNHLNGNRSPLHNILINGGVRECLIEGNICEGSREEAIKYTAPGWLANPERTSLTVSTNIIRQSNQAGGKPVIGIYGQTGNPGFYMEGFVMLGNQVATDYAPTHVVELTKVKDASIGLNYWRYGHNAALEPVRALNCLGVEVGLNHGDNAVKTT